MKVQFYTRPNCSLCEDARLMLELVKEDVVLHIEEINIEDNDDIHEKFLLRIPVIEREGVVIQEGRVDYPTLLESFTS
ncbi:glutaredoxin family protein [Paenisporosarcina sp. NPDC076898]|uniref:glutaredoxin family protein n=1 Tax=unclassified Paenisporosarcina TaxID=2642018 RepID=UPI003D0612B4